MSGVSDQGAAGAKLHRKFNANSNHNGNAEDYVKDNIANSCAGKKKYPSPISFRPTEEEREQLLRDADGMSQSAYIRQCLFGRKASKRVVPEADRVLLAQILAKLGESRIANNLNQIAYHANCGSLLLDDVTIEEINEACLHVAWMRTQLIEALGLKDKSYKKPQSSDKSDGLP